MVLAISHRLRISYPTAGPAVPFAWRYMSSIAERLKEPIDPFLDDRSFEELMDRAQLLLKCRDELLLIDNDKWTDELDDQLTDIEWRILNDWFPWLLETAAEQRVRRKERQATKKQQRRVREQIQSRNVDSRRKGFANRAMLGDFWPERKAQQSE